MKKFICTTTINKPTEALKKFASFKDWKLIVAGDLKTPHSEYNNIIYLHPEEQEREYKNLSKLIGWNCIQRRNFAFIEALKRDADIIATIDDDNIPYDFWGKNLLIDTEIKLDFYISAKSKFLDPIYITGNDSIWHRGFPLLELKNRDYIKRYNVKVKCDVQSDFWDGTPDIDAVCRLTNSQQYNFNQDYFPFSTNLLSPFNSQNTFLSRKIMKNYFMFPCIGRFDDIFASYYLQSKGVNVVYNTPSVYQQRNEHNIFKDIKDELFGYENTINFIEKGLSILPKNSVYAFYEYQNIIEKYI